MYIQKKKKKKKKKKKRRVWRYGRRVTLLRMISKDDKVEWNVMKRWMMREEGGVIGIFWKELFPRGLME